MNILSFFATPLGLLLITPIIGTVITLMFERAGISGKLKEQEFYFKRAELIEKTLMMQSQLDPNNMESEVFNTLRREVRNIVSYLDDTSQKAIDNRNVFEKFFVIKKSPTESFFAITFYLYLGMFVITALVSGFYPEIYPKFLPEYARIFFPIMMLLGTLYLRYYAFRTSTRSLHRYRSAKVSELDTEG